MDKATLIHLLERVEKATGPDREINGFIAVALRDLKPTIQPWAKENFSSWSSDSTGRVFGMHDDGSLGPNWLSDHYTASIDAALALVERVLPGWAWKFGTCSVSDDAWLVPDFNCPVHGERLKAEFGVIEAGSIWDNGIDIDRRPPGNVPLAIIEALLSALIARAE